MTQIQLDRALRARRLSGLAYAHDARLRHTGAWVMKVMMRMGPQHVGHGFRF